MSVEQSEALVQRFETMWNEDRPELAEECFAADCILHYTGRDGTTSHTLSTIAGFCRGLIRSCCRMADQVRLPRACLLPAAARSRPSRWAAAAPDSSAPA